MDTEKLNRIILKFWKNEHNNDVYYLGLCSEFAVALQRYLGGKGEITKHGLWHTVLKYNGMYCDIHGCMTENKLNFTMPIGGVGVNESTRKARPDEVAHIYGLLNERMTKHIYDGLKKAEKEI
jgi:hypothetical protein